MEGRKEEARVGGHPKVTPTDAGADKVPQMFTQSADYKQIFEPTLNPGEELQGVCIGSTSGFMSSKMVAVGVTSDRMIIQEVTRRMQAKGDPEAYSGADIESTSLGGAAGLSGGVQGAIINKVAQGIKVKTTAGKTIKLKITRGGIGGQEQGQGLEALVTWLQTNANS